MSGIRRFLILPMVVGLTIGLFGLQVAARSVSAQSYVTNVTSTSCGSGSCTLTLNAALAAGSSTTVNLQNGSSVTLSCPTGCNAGTQWTISIAGTGYAQPQLMTTTGYNPAYNYNYGYAAGACVNGSYATTYGCTSGGLSSPYYAGVGYGNGNCYGVTYGCGSVNSSYYPTAGYGNCYGLTYGCGGSSYYPATGYGNCYGLTYGCGGSSYYPATGYGNCYGPTYGCSVGTNCALYGSVSNSAYRIC